jgi:hypothetical protein
VRPAMAPPASIVSAPGSGTGDVIGSLSSIAV